jgi:hypothetical protein
MTTDALACANFTGKQGAAARPELTLRYDNLTRVLLDLDERVSPPSPPKREHKTGKGQGRVAELRESVAALKADNERAIERITDDLNGLADRLAELEARAQGSFWRRALGCAIDRPEPAARARRNLVERLRSIFSYPADAKRPSVA